MKERRKTTTDPASAGRDRLEPNTATKRAHTEKIVRCLIKIDAVPRSQIGKRHGPPRLVMVRARPARIGSAARFSNCP
jgi:hypothetical protein